MIASPEPETYCSSCRDLPEGTSTGTCSATCASRVKYREAAMVAAEAMLACGERILPEAPPKFQPLPTASPHHGWPRPIVLQRTAHRQVARKKKRF